MRKPTDESGPPIERLADDEIAQLFAFDSKFEPVLKHAQGPVYKIALFYHAAYLHAFGRSAPYGPIPPRVAAHIAKILGVEVPSPLPYPEARATFFDHAEKARRILGWRRWDARMRRDLERWLSEEARRTDDVIYLRRGFEERLAECRIVQPGQTQVERLLGRAREQAQDWITRTILVSALTPTHVEAIDGLRKLRSGSHRTTLQWLKDPIGIPSPTTIDDLLSRLECIRGLRLPVEPFEKIHPDMRRRLMKTVEAYAVDSLYADFPADRRRAFVACYLHERQKALVDLAVEAFDGVVLKMVRRSEADLADDQRKRGPAINEKLRMFLTMAGVVLDPEVPDPAVRPEIFKKIPREVLAKAMQEAEELVRPPDYNCFDYLERRYTYLRSFFPRFLRVMEFDSVETARPILEAVTALRYWNAEGIRKVPASAPIAFVPKDWRPYVLSPAGVIDRHYYELCVLDRLHAALQSGDVWAVGGRRYGNVEDLLIPREEWNRIRADCYEELGLPQDPKAWLASALADLEKQIEKTVSGLPRNPQTFVQDGKVHLKALECALLPQPLLDLKERVQASWPRVRIQDLLVDVDGCVHFLDDFRTLRGSRGGRMDFGRGLLAALIAKGCNIGITRMADLCPGVSQGTLRRTDELYLYEESLRRAYERLLGALHELPIASWLGDERISMSDGMRVTTRVGTLKAALHPHLLGPGERAITFYWHVSHQGPGFAAQVIGHDRDAAYVLDQIFHIQSELPIVKHFTDTHGATENTFGLSKPLGVEYAPRIKDVHDQDLYFPPGFAVSGPFKAHFAGPVNVELIERHWDDYVRILSSIRRGTTSAVLLSLRLSSYARQNSIYRALREVGRIWKTRFILRYYDEPDFRRQINAGLNRMELFNYLARHLFYARRGENWEREFEQQLNRASALLILANACVFWNSIQLSRMLKRFRAEGIECHPEDFRHISPYAFDHIIPYGEYRFDLRRKDLAKAYEEAQTL